jgi:hypothetical protein
LTVAVGALSQSMIKAHELAKTTEEKQVALAAARQMAETIQDETFAEVFRRFNSDPDDDPGGPGMAHGSGFEVAGLTLQDGDTDGLTGAIVFPTADLGGTAVALRENIVDPALAMPRDLNGDDEIDNLDHAADYDLLPVTIRVEWTGATGDRSTELHFLMANGG